jgi:hypothetical protein
LSMACLASSNSALPLLQRSPKNLCAAVNAIVSYLEYSVDPCHMHSSKMSFGFVLQSLVAKFLSFGVSGLLAGSGALSP